ncbi:MAG: aspartyl protease family protein [Rhizomicrobium sp.]|jgi:predicted aspartyl protease
MNGNWIKALLTLGVIGAVTPALADDCKLMQLGSVAMSGTPDAAVLIPVSIEGTSKLMAIDTGSPLSAVDPTAADELHLIRHNILQGYMFNSAGQTFTQMAVIHALDIGQMHAENVRILQWPSQMWTDQNIAGTLGADLLRNYDVDIDTDTKTLKLFSQDHCPGKVVYWPNAAVSVVPIRVVASSGHIIVPVVLDGHNIDALLDTGAFGTILSQETAENTFGLQPNSPDMTPSGEFRGSVPVYRHTFKSLVLEGITIDSPTVYIWDDQTKYGMQQSQHTGTRINDTNETSGKTDMALGMQELRHLHLYIAYKEQKMYVSAAAPTVVPAASVPDKPAGPVQTH